MVHMLTNLIVTIILQYTHISNRQVAYLKLTKWYSSFITSIKLEKKWLYLYLEFIPHSFTRMKLLQTPIWGLFVHTCCLLLRVCCLVGLHICLLCELFLLWGCMFPSLYLWFLCACSLQYPAHNRDSVSVCRLH